MAKKEKQKEKNQAPPIDLHQQGFKTHHAMNNRMFAKQNYFPWRTDEPLPILFGTRLRDSEGGVVVEGEFFDRAADGVTLVGGAGSDVALVCTSCESNGAGVEQSALEVIKQVNGVFNPNAEADKVLWQTSCSTSGRVDGRMSAVGGSEVSACVKPNQRNGSKLTTSHRAC